jgi:general secretion pathway protein H
LTEILVVMVIVGLLTTAVLLAGPVVRLGLADEAERFAARLTRARDEAVMTNHTIEVRVWPKGYEFEIARPGGRTRLNQEPFGLHSWAEDTTVVMSAGDGRTRIAFDATGMASPATVDLMRRNARIRVSVDASGAIAIDDQSQ